MRAPAAARLPDDPGAHSKRAPAPIQREVRLALRRVEPLVDELSSAAHGLSRVARIDTSVLDRARALAAMGEDLAGSLEALVSHVRSVLQGLGAVDPALAGRLEEDLLARLRPSSSVREVRDGLRSDLGLSISRSGKVLNVQLTRSGRRGFEAAFRRNPRDVLRQLGGGEDGGLVGRLGRGLAAMARRLDALEGGSGSSVRAVA